VSIAVALSCAVAGVLIACTDDTDEPTTTANPDAGLEGGTTVDATADVGSLANDASTKPDGTSNLDAGDAGSEVTRVLGSTGVVTIGVDSIIGSFYEDDTILRTASAPDCVAHVRSSSKGTSSAGTLSVGGPIVGADGGAPNEIELTAEVSPFAYEHFGPVFPADEVMLLQVQVSGGAAFPALPLQALRTSPPASVAITKPAPDVDGNIIVPSNAPFEITWTAPAGALADQRLVVALSGLNVEGGAKRAALYCSYPLSAGTAALPAALLAELKVLVGANAPGLFHAWAGGQKEVATATSSYVIEVANALGTTLEYDIPALLE
jgi:hypothetical protein